MSVMTQQFMSLPKQTTGFPQSKALSLLRNVNRLQIPIFMHKVTFRLLLNGALR